MEKKKKGEFKTRSVSLKLTETQYQMFKDDAEGHGLKVSRFLRTSALLGRNSANKHFNKIMDVD